MWPFHKANEEEELLRRHMEEWPLGRRFIYLGKEFVVTRNIHVVPYFYIPIVYADYVDNNGVIREKCFDVKWLDKEGVINRVDDLTSISHQI